MNWYIGQEIVCIKSHSQGLVKKDSIYTIIALKTPICKCMNVVIDVGAVKVNKYGIYSDHCMKCGANGPLRNDPVNWVSEELFAPLEYDQQAIEELLKITQPNELV